MRATGQSHKRVDARDKVTGAALYPGDIDMDGQLWLKIRFSDRLHARVRRINCEAALALPGVHAVLTAADVPVNEYGLVLKDQPVLCGPGSDIPGSDVVRCYADMVAAVVADTEALTARAVALLDVEYEDLPAVTDPELAMQDGQPQLHADCPNNIRCHYRIRHGDLDAGRAAAEVVVEGEYLTGWQEHAYLQPEAGLGYIDGGGRITIAVAGQWAHVEQEAISHAMALPPERVRVIHPAIGGAFGGREDMSVQIVLALAAQRTGRPVKVIWSREESILNHHKRHPITVRARWGATRLGKLVFAETSVIGDAGAYNYTSNKVMANANLTVSGPYVIPNCHIDTWGVYTNNVPSGAFRGFGAPQGLFAAEGQMNRLAAALDMDPLELRLLNSIREGEPFVTGEPFPPGVSMPEVWRACGRESFWQDSANGNRSLQPSTQDPDRPWLRRGRGIAGGFKNIGFSFGFPESCHARVELRGGPEIEQVVLYHAGSEVGQGAHTAFRQMVADAVGVPAERVRMVLADTATTGSSGSASASRLTFMAGNAIRGAAELALRKWEDEERPALAEYTYRPPKTTALDPQTGRGRPNFAYGYVAQAVEVEVDLETGLVQLLQVVSANDVGRAINPDQIVGQTEGAIVQAQGYALMENLQVQDGRILNPFLSTYLIPTVLDVPQQVRTVLLETPDPQGPWGARGMAEMPFLPLAPAIAAAIQDATGVWVDHLPMTPERVLQALQDGGERNS
ncbi:MAG: molybdopterin-dependent oxidoreductase [Anaerolineae bacterium]|nr:molybdopterin-dependent oxidoreductase [Anaerolineae bacterium]